MQKRVVKMLRRSALEAVAARQTEMACRETDPRRKRKWTQAYRRATHSVQHWPGFTEMAMARIREAMRPKGREEKA